VSFSTIVQTSYNTVRVQSSKLSMTDDTNCSLADLMWTGRRSVETKITSALGCHVV